MAYLYRCEACLDGRHDECEKHRPVPPGLIGGGVCICTHEPPSGFLCEYTISGVCRGIPECRAQCSYHGQKERS
jgi:hypothetical protein